MSAEGEPTYKVRHGAALWREVEHETILLDVESSRYLGINTTGTLLWGKLVEGATRAELIAHLREAFDVDEQQAGEDVDAFLDACMRRGLLER